MQDAYIPPPSSQSLSYYGRGGQGDGAVARSDSVQRATFVEGAPRTMRCVAVGGFPLPEMRLTVGAADVTRRFVLSHSVTLSGVSPVLSSSLLYPHVPSSCLLYPSAPSCTLLRPSVPSCTLLHPLVPSSGLLYLSVFSYTLLCPPKAPVFSCTFLYPHVPSLVTFLYPHVLFSSLLHVLVPSVQSQ